MTRIWLPVLAALISANGFAQTNVLESIAEIIALPNSEFAKGIPVRIKATILAQLHSVSRDNGRMIIADETGSFFIEHIKGTLPAIGDMILATGQTSLSAGIQQPSIHCKEFAVIGQGAPVRHEPVGVTDVTSGHRSFNLVSVSGVITEICHDEIDPKWNYMILKENGVPLYVAVPLDDLSHEDLNRLVEAEVTISGAVFPHYCAERMFVGPHLEIWSKSCISIDRPAPTNPFSAPYLPDIIHVSPNELVRMRRHRIEGIVLAAWHPNKALVREDSKRLMEIELAEGQELPRVGNRLATVGFPTTDLFRLKLTRSLYKVITTIDEHGIDDTSPAEGVTARKILLDDNGKERLNQHFFGRLIRLHGSVRSLPAESETTRRMFIDSDGFLVPVDLHAISSGARDLSLGCDLDVTGICIMEAKSWRDDNLFPVLGGFTLVPRSGDDIRVLSRPSWWTPGRLLIVIGSLFLTLVAFVVWNRILNRLIKRRSQQLFREQVAHAGSDLKVDERTRLAVELHDSLSQTLTGVSFQIDAAEKARQRDPSRIEKHLAIAKRTLLSCREELRNCLWDLRNNALEESDTTTAIRRTVEPHLGEAQLILDVEVPRAKLSDNTFHAILCILRELSGNAVRHGEARHVSITGRLADGALTFSVTDDGCGFDPDNHPGMDEGHFGLQGIAERLDTLQGTLSIFRTADTGTTISFSIKA